MAKLVEKLPIAIPKAKKKRKITEKNLILPIDLKPTLYYIIIDTEIFYRSFL